MWFESSACKIFVKDFVGTEEFFLHSILYGNGGYEVGIIDVEYDKICIATI